MCGIAGIYYFPRTAGIPPHDSTRAVLARINGSQKHRGPDDQGLWISDDGHIGLGHTRLSIIDLSADGKQPMSNEDGRIWISFNGEIYNFQSLKVELQAKGHIFQSHTDTEVIIHAYEQWGENAFSRLRGMFAFALWDGLSKRLYLVKDRYGIKPLYYYINGDFCAFSSEVRALLSSNLFAPEKSVEGLINFLLTGSIPLPATSDKNIRGLVAGHYLIIEDGKHTLKKYYDIKNEFQNNIKYDPDKIRYQLEESVKIHLISDAPLGIFLSGGIDSSAIVALASNVAEQNIITLSIIFEEESFSEAKYQHLISERYHTDHREITLSNQLFWEKIPDALNAIDQPTIDGFNTYFISYAAQCAGLKTVLSGTGGDEIFGGYPHFHRPRALRVLEGLKNIAGNFSPSLLSGLPGKLKKLGFLSLGDNLGPYLAIRGLFTPGEIADLTGYAIDFITNSAKKMALNNPKLNLIDNLTYMEFLCYLQNQLLKDIDFMSMAHSIEVRVPFIDPVIVNSILSVSSDQRIDKFVPKALLTKPLKDLLPDEVVYRPKMTFAFPINQWLDEDNFNIDNLSRLFSKTALTGLWKNFKAGREIWAKPWALNIACNFF